MEGVRWSVSGPMGIVELALPEWRHIQDFHPEVSESAVRYTIQEPQLIAVSSKFPSDNVYFALGADWDHPNLYCKVVVDLSIDVGRIRTAMYQKDLQGAKIPGGIKYGPKAR